MMDTKSRAIAEDILANPNIFGTGKVRQLASAYLTQCQEIERLKEENLVLLGVIEESGDTKLAIKALEAFKDKQ